MKLDLVKKTIKDFDSLFNRFDYLSDKSSLSDKESVEYINILFTFRLVYLNLDKVKDKFIDN